MLWGLVGFFGLLLDLVGVFLLAKDTQRTLTWLISRPPREATYKAYRSGRLLDEPHPETEGERAARIKMVADGWKIYRRGFFFILVGVFIQAIAALGGAFGWLTETKATAIALPKPSLVTPCLLGSEYS